MARFNIVKKGPSDENFIDFICLHFPEQKVMAVAVAIGQEARAEVQLQMRKRTSLWGYWEMSRTNTMFMLMIKLTSKVGEAFPEYTKTLKMLDVLELEFPEFEEIKISEDYDVSTNLKVLNDRNYEE